MTNGDKIHAMTDEEFAKFMDLGSCGCPSGRSAGEQRCLEYESCEKCWLEWLKQEARQ